MKKLTEITPEGLQLRLKRGEKITLIDVREPDEYAICHLKEAQLIPLAQLRNHIRELNPNDSIVLYCHHGTRSAQATLWLQKMGFKDAKNLGGGIDAWAESIDPLMERY